MAPIIVELKDRKKERYLMQKIMSICDKENLAIKTAKYDDPTLQISELEEPRYSALSDVYKIMVDTVDKLGHATAKNVAEKLKRQLPATTHRLNELCEKGVMQRQKAGEPRRWVYILNPTWKEERYDG
jgi:predicted transcriptional regulator